MDGTRENAAQQVVITGAGLICALGTGPAEVFRAMQEGRCGVAPMTLLEQEYPAGAGFPDGGQAVAIESAVADEREVSYLRRAMMDALTNAGLKRMVDTGAFGLPYPAPRCGIILGTTLHGMRAAGRYLRTGNREDLRNFQAGAVIRQASHRLGLEGPALTTCSACSSSLGAIALGVTLLQAGQVDLIIAGGYDPVSEYAFAGFNSLRLVAPARQMPFARNRAGMKVGEGYGIVVLERAGDARKRSAGVLAAIAGIGESADAHHLTQPHPRGDGAARAVTSALENAGISPGQIDFIAAHATATPDNDAAEYQAYERVFGQQLPKIPVVAFKSHLAHTLGAAGAVELIASAMSLQAGAVPPMALGSVGEEEFALLKLSDGSSPARSPERSLNVSLGFGGANTCIVLEKSPSTQAKAMLNRPVFITGIGAVFPNAIGNDKLVSWLSRPSAEPMVGEQPRISEEEIAALLSARRVRRMSLYVRLQLASAILALADAGWEANSQMCSESAVMLGTTHGSGAYCNEYYQQIVQQGITAANPMLFAEGVPNAAAAHLSLALGVRGACQTIIGSRTAGLDALGLAAARIASGQWDRAIVGAGEEYCTTINQAYVHCGVYPPREVVTPFVGKSQNYEFVAGCGAVTLICESEESIVGRGGTVASAYGCVTGYASRSPGEAGYAASVADILKSLQHPSRVLSSCNGTWIDDVELAGIDLAKQNGHGCVYSSLVGHLAESFSATPLAGIASTLLLGKLPEQLGNAQWQDTHTKDDFAALATDYAGLTAGARIAPM